MIAIQVQFFCAFFHNPIELLDARENAKQAKNETALNSQNDIIPIVCAGRTLWAAILRAAH